jgi:farnesyl diphosphate synthase
MIFFPIRFQDNYGRHDEKKEAAVKELYRELDLSKVYSDYEESSYQALLNLINTSSGSLPTSVFVNFAKKIYKRQK